MRRALKIAIAVLFVVLIWIGFAPFLARNLIVETSIGKADAIMVLSGSSSYLERTEKAAELYNAGLSRRVLLTDDGGFGPWSQKEKRNPPFVYLAQQNLNAHGVRIEDIEVLKPNVTGTIYEARLLKSKISGEKWKSVILVTSPYHTRRALWTFRSEIENPLVRIGMSTMSVEQRRIQSSVWWLSISGWQTIVGEYVKFIGYWMFY